MKQAEAHIFQINISDGGVPKRSQPTAEVTTFGLRGDWQRDTEHHGGRDRALCLYSLDHILWLQEEGHPIYPGSTGENLTIVGLDWSIVVPGTQFRLGDQVTIEITGYAAPCRTIQDSFAGQGYGRISAKTNPGWARAYARVLVPGPIAIGDKVAPIE
jgi:MOSC domain-containing protein YiiM